MTTNDFVRLLRVRAAEAQQRAEHWRTKPRPFGTRGAAAARERQGLAWAQQLAIANAFESLADELETEETAA